MKFYNQTKVKNSILDFFYSGSRDPIREGAFYDKNKEEIRRQHPDEGKDSVLVIDSEETMAEVLNSGARSFYGSYWRYSEPSETSGVIGRDLLWTIEAKEGGLKVAKEMTNLFLEALESEGFPQPLVKYSGEVGFDILLPLEDLQITSEDHLSFLSDLHNELTEYSSGYIEEKTQFDRQKKKSGIRFLGNMGTCFLTERRWRRGLLLAPMSLHPSSGLVSVPVRPSEVPEFSVIDATPKKVRPREWDFSKRRTGLETGLKPGTVSSSSI